MGVQWAGVDKFITCNYYYITGSHGTRSQSLLGRGMDTHFTNLLFIK